MNHPETPGLFSSSFRSIEQKFGPVENHLVRISLRKFQNLNFHLIKQYSLNSNIIITTYSCIYLYIQQFLLLFISLISFFGTIHKSHYIISIIF